MPRISSIAVCAARVPLDRVTSFATRTVKWRDYCLVKVRSSDGAEGIGFCYVGTAGGSIAAKIVEELLAPILIGQESDQVEALWEKMYRETILHGRTGTVMRGISILDIAMSGDDLRARIEANLARQAQPELSAIHLVRSRADITASMPRFVTAFLEQEVQS